MNDTTLHFRFVLSYSTEVDDFSLDVTADLPGSGVIGIYGRSGSGKTTLLRCIAGLQRPDSGELIVNDQPWQNDKLFLPPYRRPVGYIFQEASLFPHLSAADNLRFARERADRTASAINFDFVVRLLDIKSLLTRFPHQLSGGERQRVAIARALLTNPQLLLMDEPLASLDTERKQEILPYLERLHAELKIPLLYVSHSMEEISRLADHLVIMDKGRIVAAGVLKAVLSRLNLPVRFEEDRGVVVEATVAERDSRWHLARTVFSGGELWVRDDGDAVGTKIRIRILVKDVSLALHAYHDSSILNVFQGELVELADDAHAAMSLARVKVGDCDIVSRITRRSLDHLQLRVGKTVWVQIKSVAIIR